MYPVSKEALDLFLKGYRQTADITFGGTEENLKITESDIVSGGLSINRYCVSGTKIEIGSAIASELSLVLDNQNDKFSNVVFEGAELYVQIGIKKWDAHRWEKAQMHYIPLGYFTVDESPRKLNQITLSALDRMVHFDKAVDWSLVMFPITVGQLLEKVCRICNIALGTKAAELLNYDYIITEQPESDDLTWRQVLSYIGEITCTCAFMDWRGQLVLKWYEPTDMQIIPSDRYVSDLYEREIVITGAAVTADDEIYLAGSDDYAINIEDNPLIQHDYEAIAASLYKKLGGFSYAPFSAEIKHYPQIYPLDMISFVDKNGAAHETIVTDVTFTLNANTVIEGKGETATKNGYAAQNPLTKREQSILEKMKREQNKQLESREQAVLGLNETIWNSLGLQTTEVDDGAGGIILYFHDGNTLEESTIIYTFRAGGFAWTDKWDGEDTVWQHGITRDGNAILNILTAYKIQAEQIEAGAITAEKLSVEYKTSVADNVKKSITEFEQNFIAANGKLESYIKNRFGDYSSSEELESKFEQTTESIILSVTKTLVDYSTTEEINSAIEVLADHIAMKVSRDDLISEINLAEGVITVNSDRLVINSTNFKLTKDGSVTASNVTLDGSLKTVYGDNEYYTHIHDGVIEQFFDGKRISYFIPVGSEAYTQLGILGSTNYDGVMIGSRSSVSGITMYYQCNLGKAYTQEGCRHHFVGSVKFDDSVYIYGDPRITGELRFLNTDTNTYLAMLWYDWGNDGLNVGRSTRKLYLNGSNIYANGSPISTSSDERKKHDIQPLDEKYLRLIKAITPVSFKYNSDVAQSGRTHTGFIAQNVLAKMTECGLTAKDFAAFVDLNNDGEEYALRYEEFIPLILSYAQSLESRLETLERRDINA